MELREDISTKPALLLSGRPFNEKSDEEFCPPSMEYPQEVLSQCILGAYMEEIHFGGVNLMNLQNNQTLHTAPFPPIRTTCTTTSNPGLHADWKWSDWKHPNTAGIHVSGEIKKSKTALLFHPSFEGWFPPSSLQWYESFQDGVWRWASVQIYMLDLHMI